MLLKRLFNRYTFENDEMKTQVWYHSLIVNNLVPYLSYWQRWQINGAL
jgi:hypothetical protein